MFRQIETSGKVQNEVASKVQKFRKLYGRVHDLKEMTNDAFSLQLLVTVFEIFVDLVFILFVNIAQYQFHETNLGLRREFYLRSWPLILSLKLFVLVYACDSLANESKKTGVIVHRLFSYAEGKTKTEVFELTDRTIRMNMFSKTYLKKKIVFVSIIKNKMIFFLC